MVRIKVRLRVIGQYCVGVYDYAVPDSLALNGNKPMYEFNTSKIAAKRNDLPTAQVTRKMRCGDA